MFGSLFILSGPEKGETEEELELVDVAVFACGGFEDNCGASKVGYPGTLTSRSDCSGFGMISDFMSTREF